MIALLSPLWATVRVVAQAVPVWAWVLVAALLWGGWQRHQAKSVAGMHAKAVATAAAEREKQLQDDAAETERMRKDAERIAHEARQKAQALAADVARARSNEQRLLDQLTAITTDGGAKEASVADGSPPAGQTAGVLADVLGKCVRRVRRVAEYADEASAAGAACERAYDSLTAGQAEPPADKPASWQFWK
jgi:hypothetical protein